MLLYLIKSGACMAIFLLFYKLLLENENMHVFKRFYLLGALVASLVIPNLVFVEYVEQVVVEEATTTPVIQSYTNIDVEQTTPATEMDMINYPLIFAMVYGLGLVVFGFRFFKNLFQIMRRIRKNTKLKVGFITKVLLQEKMSPHTFFKYVFLNKSKFETNTIPKEVLLHEETHAKQRHSLDVIFIEILQVILWFNPLVFFFKKSIKLNHEFLADQAVIKNDFDKTSYQNTLLSYLSPDSENRYQPQLANAINYSSIKKRFTIMKRETSKKAVLIRSLMLLPLLALMLYGFSQTKIEERKSTENNTTVINDINIEIESNGDLLVNNKTVLLADISKEIDRLNVSLEPYYIRNYVTANILYDESQVDLIDEIQVALQYAGISNIEHTSKRTANIVGRKGFRSSLYNGKTLDEARALRQEKVFDKIDSIEDDNRLLEIVWVDIKNENEIWFKNELTKLEDLNKNITSAYGNTLEKNNFIIQVNATDTLKSEFVDKINTELQLLEPKIVQVFTEEFIMKKSDYKDIVGPNEGEVHLHTNKMTLEGSPLQEVATKEQISEYNVLAKKYSDNKKGEVRIRFKELHRMQKLYKKLTEEQKKNAKALPHFPPIPEPPNRLISKDGASRKLMAEYNALAKKYNAILSKSKSIQIKKKDVERLEYIYSLMSDKQKTDAEPFPDFPPMPEPPKAPKVMKGEMNNVPAPPQPPKPKTPLDYVIEMAKKNARFYYEGKEISSDKAINIMKKNKDMNIDSRASNNGQRPIIKLSTEPINH